MSTNNPDETMDASHNEQASETTASLAVINFLDAPRASSFNDVDDDEFWVLAGWEGAFEAITDAVIAAFQASPRSIEASGPEPNREEFRQYWWGVFTELIETVAADNSIPKSLTTPETDKFAIKLFDDPRTADDCPNTLPKVNPTITLENDRGVTKMDLVRGLRDYLFGETAPEINLNPRTDWKFPEARVGPTGVEVATMDTTLPYKVNWVKGDTDDYDEELSHHKQVPEVFMYCCWVGDFKEQAGYKEEEEPPKGVEQA